MPAVASISSTVRLPKIGKYRIIERIGKGGQATVYKGKNPQNEEFVAVKVLPGALASDSVQSLRFAQEAKVTRRLNHPHIVRVLDFGLDGAKPFLVMEFVDGESLGQKLDREGRLSEAEAVQIIVQAGEALHWAHQRRLIHRDVKPDNLLITNDGQVKVADLGLAKNLDGEFDLTRTLSCLGTPNFMSPEQFQDAKRADALSDLYSLAATMYQTVTGELPFRARTAAAIGAIYKKKLANEITPPRRLVPELSERVDNAILQALRANRSERQQSVLEFVESLAGISSASIVDITSPSPPLTAKDERRIMKRYTSRRKTACQPTERSVTAPWVGKVVNISTTGLCLELRRRFEPGTLLTVDLNGDESKRRSLMVCVKWVKQLSRNSYQLGCQHDQPLCDFEVRELA
ncbi:MAG: serine/threonine protein kinase [Gemmataceae bacterium]|nr:serine/threonine protein kinase [Gemmataceae bacterium]